MTKFIQISILLASFLGFFNCSTQTAGSSMETENSISLVVLDSNQNPVNRAVVKIRPSWYLHFPDSALSLSDTFYNMSTDENGKVYIADLNDGNYLISIYYQNSASVFSYNYSTTEDSVTKNDTTLSTQLSSFAKINGVIPLPKGSSSAWVQIFGLTKATQTDSLGYFELDSLPSGNLKLSAWLPDSNQLIGEQNIITKAGKTVRSNLNWTIINSSKDSIAWRQSIEIRGSDFISDWMQPLSLPSVITIKLSKDQISQNQKIPNNKTLRVYNKNGDPLISRVRHWDEENNYAFIRVRLESIQDTSGLWTIRWDRQYELTDESEKLWYNISDSLKYFLTALPWENFEDNNTLADIIEPTPTSYWYFGPSDSASVSPDPALGLTAAFQPAGQDRTGQAVQLLYTAKAPQWVLLGSKMGQGSHSLATLDSIVLWMRGSGTFSVGFDKLESLDTDVKAWMHGTLDSMWTKYSIRPEDFLAPDNLGDNVGWLAIRDSVTNFSLFTNGGSEFWVDDIVFYGINRDNIIEP